MESTPTLGGMGRPPHKKVKLNLIGLDGNAFSVMGAWKKQARKEGWTQEEIDFVLKDAMSGEYNHLLATIMKYSK